MIQSVMCVNAVVATTHRVMCAGVAAQMIQWVMFVAEMVPMIQPDMMRMMTRAVIGRVQPTTAPSASRAVQMIPPQTIAVEVAAVDAAVMTPPAMIVAAKVAAATIRAKFGSPAALDGSLLSRAV